MATIGSTTNSQLLSGEPLAEVLDLVVKYRVLLSNVFKRYNAQLMAPQNQLEQVATELTRHVDPDIWAIVAPNAAFNGPVVRLFAWNRIASRLTDFSAARWKEINYPHRHLRPERRLGLYLDESFEASIGETVPQQVVPSGHGPYIKCSRCRLIQDANDVAWHTWSQYKLSLGRENIDDLLAQNALDFFNKYTALVGLEESTKRMIQAELPDFFSMRSLLERIRKCVEKTQANASGNAVL
ncbi:hypothetical protein GGR56DRAFT_633543 [Xylariaceae sp. FL0804]|nr:hypothetical protein GGR56DRAFT_633543 [Xylariaceae sp. FL0804]